MKKMSFGEVLKDGGGSDDYYRAEDVEPLVIAARNVIETLRDSYDSMGPERRRDLADSLESSLRRGAEP